LGAPACSDRPTELVTDPNLKIEALKVYRCDVFDQTGCLARGTQIPADTLPPRADHFVVWAYYNGLRTIEWRLVWPGDSIIIDKTSSDSSHVWITLDGGRAPYYTLRVLVATSQGFAWADSLRWVFPN